MQNLTKKYEDGSFGVADDLPVGENSHAFKKLLIDKMGAYEYNQFSFTEKELEKLIQLAMLYDQERKVDSTRDPIVAVQVKVKRLVPEGYGGKRVLVINSDGEFTTIQDAEDIKEYLIDMEDEYFFEESEDEEGNTVWTLKDEEFDEFFDDFLNYGCNLTHPAYSNVKFEVFYEEDDWKSVAFFFTRKDAEDYCQYQAHNLNEPRVFSLYSGYANHGDFPILLAMLKRLGQHLADNQTTSI